MMAQPCAQPPFLRGAVMLNSRRQDHLCQGGRLRNPRPPPSGRSNANSAFRLNGDDSVRSLSGPVEVLQRHCCG
jgi:hypothetical protein